MSSSGFRILSPTAILGYGFPETSFRRGLERQPHAIAVDGGSSDPGPYYLGAGKPFVSRAAVRRDLALMVAAARAHDIPLIIGTAGGSGARAHLDWTLAILADIAREQGFVETVGVVDSEVDKALVRAQLREGRLEALDNAPALDEEKLEQTTAVVAQIGISPIVRALDEGFRIVVCGRAYDPAVFAAPAVRAGYSQALALHMGKILECAAIAADPGSGRDCVLGTLYEDHFVLEPLDGKRQFTDYSVAAHALYEKSDPYRLPGPEGVLDLTEARYHSLEQGRARVQGSRLIAPERPRIKLEGARPIGYRTICIAGVRDPYFIERLDTIMEAARSDVQAELDGVRVAYHAYGRDAVMGTMEPRREASGHEVGLLLEALGETQEKADAACGMLRSTLLHYGYEGRVSTAGNLALPFSPSDVSCGQVYEFSLYHLMDIDEAQSLFNAKAQEIGA
jgi:hypothetical protein